MTTRFGILIFALISSILSAQSPPAAVPTGQHIDWAKHFFISAAAEKTARQQLYADLDHFQQWKGRLTESGQQLFLALEARDKLSQKVALHEAYLHLKNATDTRDTLSQRDESQLDADYNRQTAFIESEILAISAEKLAQFIAETLGLAKYRFEIEKTQRNKAHAR